MSWISEQRTKIQRARHFVQLDQYQSFQRRSQLIGFIFLPHDIISRRYHPFSSLLFFVWYGRTAYWLDASAFPSTLLAKEHLLDLICCLGTLKNLPNVFVIYHCPWYWLMVFIFCILLSETLITWCVISATKASLHQSRRWTLVQWGF